MIFGERGREHRAWQVALRPLSPPAVDHDLSFRACVLECGGKQRATPLWKALDFQTAIDASKWSDSQSGVKATALQDLPAFRTVYGKGEIPHCETVHRAITLVAPLHAALHGAARRVPPLTESKTPNIEHRTLNIECRLMIGLPNQAKAFEGEVGVDGRNFGETGGHEFGVAASGHHQQVSGLHLAL